MNKIFKVKQNAFGQSVVCSEKTKARGKVKSIVLAVATASAMMASVDTLAATIATGTGDGKVAMVGDSRGNIAIASKGTAGTSGVKMPLVYGQSLNAVAIGTNSEANANNTIAIGNATTALDHNDIALGNNATASGLQGSSSTGLGSVAIGNNATALTGSGVSIANNGPNNIRTSVALGTDTYANSGSVAIGFNVSARNSNVFIGSNISPGDVMSNPGSGNTVAIGSDITMKKGLFDSVILGGENTFGEGQSSTVVGTSNKADNLASSNVIGMYNNLTKSTAYILGNHNTVTNSKVGTANSLNNAWIGGSIIGSENKVANASGVVMGNALNISNSNSFLAIGNAAIVQNASNSVSLGARAYNSHERSVALGYESDSTAPTSTQNASVNGLSYGNFAGNVSDSTVSVGGIYSVGGAPLKRQIVNVAAGQIAATSTDAINGSQLYFVADTVGNLANSVKTKLGGNTALAPNGTITMTNIGGTGQNTIHDAIAFVNAKQGGAAVNVVQGDGITVTNATVNGGKTFTVGLSDATKANITKAQTDATKGIADAAAAQANATKAIADAKAADNKAVAAQNTANTAVTKADAAQATADKAAADIKALDDIAVKYDSTAKDTVTLGGADGTTITNVKDGAITADSKDAVNGGQLYALTEKVNNLDATDVVAGKGTTVTKSTQGNLNTYTVSVSDETLANITKAQTDAAKGIADAAAAQANATKAIADAKAADNKAVAAQNTANTAVTKADAAQATADKAAADIKALDDIAVKYDSTAKDTVTLGGADGTTITNVKDGAITADSKDAVNGSQLYAVKGVADTAKATADANKVAISALDDKKADKSALAATDAKVKANADAIAKGFNVKTADGTSTNYQLGDTVSILGGKNIDTTTTADGITVSLKDDIAVKTIAIDGSTVGLSATGINAGDLKVTGVADGAITTDSKDAVNGSQLYATNQQVINNVNNIAKLGGNVQSLNRRVDNLADNVKKNKKRNDAGIASTAAMANIPQVMLAGKSGVGVGVGHRSGQNAIAVGYSRASDNAKHIIKLSAGIDTQSKATFGAGYMYQW